MADNDLNYFRGDWTAARAAGTEADEYGVTGVTRQREEWVHEGHIWVYTSATDGEVGIPGAAGVLLYRNLGPIGEREDTVLNLDTTTNAVTVDPDVAGGTDAGRQATVRTAIGAQIEFPAESAAIDIATAASITFPARDYVLLNQPGGGIGAVFNLSTTAVTITFTADEDTPAERSVRIRRDIAADPSLVAISTDPVDPDDGLVLRNGLLGVNRAEFTGRYNHLLPYQIDATFFITRVSSRTIAFFQNVSGTVAPAGAFPREAIRFVNSFDANVMRQEGELVAIATVNQGTTTTRVWARDIAAGASSSNPTDPDSTGWTELTLTDDIFAEDRFDVDVNDVFGLTEASATGGQSIRRNAGDTAWEYFTPGTGTGGGGASTVPAFAQRTDYVDREIVSQGTSLYIVNNVAQANAAADPANANSGFLLVGEFDSTHVISYDDQEIIPRGSFTLREGDTLFIQPATDFIGNVEVYQIRTNDLVVVGGTGGTFGISGGTSIANDASNALNQFRALLRDRGVRTDNIGLLTVDDLGAGLADTGDQITVSLDQVTLDFVGGNVEVADGGITNDKIADRTIEHLKLADNAVTNRNIGDRAVHGDNIDQQTIERENLSLALQAQFDERGIVFHQTEGEIETGIIIRPSNLGSNNDWQMHVLSDGQRTITFTEIDAPDISVGDHFSLRAGSVAPLTGTQQTNAVLRTPPITVPEVRTLTGNLASGPGAGEVTLSGIEIDGETPTTDNTFTIGAGTVLRAGTHITIVNVEAVVNSASFTLTATQHTDNAATLTNGTAITPLTETHDVTRIELSLVEGSMVGTQDVFDYLDALAASGTEGGDGVYTFSPQSSIYTRRTIIHTAEGDRVGNINNMPENDFISNEEEFRVTEVRIGSGNSRNTAGTFSPLTGVTYENVFASWSSVAANGEVYLVWRGDQTEIDAIIAAMATIMNVSSNTDTGIYFNGNPAGIIIPSDGARTYIRVIRNPTNYHNNGANAISRALRIRTSERGQRNAYRLRSNHETLAPTRVQSLFSNLTSVQNHTDEVSARVRFIGIDASGQAIATLPVERFGTQVTSGIPIAIETLYYSHNTNGQFPDPQVPDPGSRIRINETPYSAGTTISFEPVAGIQLIADIRGPSAQRVANDLSRTFITSRNSRIGALWFADSGVAFSEVNSRVSIPLADVTFGHHLQANLERNWTPQHLVPGAVDRLSHVTFSANTRIGWRRDGDNFVVTVSGDDREHVGFAFRNFLEDRVGRHSTLYFRSDSIGSPADDAAAALLPYIAIDLPNIEGYDGGSLARMTAIENQEPRFPAPDSQYDQAGATALSLFGLQELDTETARLPNGKTFTLNYPAGVTDITLSAGGGSGVSVYTTNAAFVAARNTLVDGAEFIIRSATETFVARDGAAALMQNTNAQIGRTPPGTNLELGTGRLARFIEGTQYSLYRIVPAGSPGDILQAQEAIDYFNNNHNAGITTTGAALIARHLNDLGNDGNGSSAATPYSGVIFGAGAFGYGTDALAAGIQCRFGTVLTTCIGFSVRSNGEAFLAFPLVDPGLPAGGDWEAFRASQTLFSTTAPGVPGIKYSTRVDGTNRLFTQIVDLTAGTEI